MYKKLVVIGEVGSGKSTIIRTLSEIETVDTDVASTQDIGKPLTTVGIDYGRISLGEDDAIGLYGVPGQGRYSFIWDMVKEDMWGCVLLIKSGPVHEKEKILNLINTFIKGYPDVPFVVGVTHADTYPPETENISAFFLKQGLNPPVFSIDAREKENSLLLLQTILSLHNAYDFVG